MSGPAVDIVMPAYNMALTIAQTIRCCAAQSYPNVRLLVVDDGSDDDTVAVARRVIEQTALRAEVNLRPHVGNPGAVRNIALAEAQAPLVQFLDADDLLTHRKIEHQVRRYEATDLIPYCDYRFFRAGDTGRVDVERRGPPTGDHWPADPCAQFRQYTVIHRFLFPLAALREAGGFDESLSHAEDLDLWLRLLSLGWRFDYQPFVGALYRDSVSHSLSAPRAEAECHLRVARRLPAYLPAGSLTDEVRRAIAELQHDLETRLDRLIITPSDSRTVSGPSEG